MYVSRRYIEGQTYRKIYVCKRCRKAGRPGAVRAYDYVCRQYQSLCRNDETGKPVWIEQDYNCPGCGRDAIAKTVEGRFSETHLCNAKCTGATGPSCDCSCGGKNHGGSYLAG